MTNNNHSYDEIQEARGCALRSQRQCGRADTVRDHGHAQVKAVVAVRARAGQRTKQVWVSGSVVEILLRGTFIGLFPFLIETKDRSEEN